MPTVPPRISPAVTEKPERMPAAMPRISVSDLTKESRAIAQLGGVIQQTANAAAQIVVEQNVQAAKDAAITFDAGLRQFEMDAQQNRPLDKAAGLVDDYDKFVEKLDSDVQESLNDAQKRIYQKQTAGKRVIAKQGVTNYQLGQLKAAGEQKDQILINSAMAEAAQAMDETTTRLYMDDVWNGIQSRARRNGWSGEQVQDQWKKAQGRVRAGQVENLTMGRQWDAASTHLEKYGANIDPKTKQKLKSTIDSGLRLESVNTAVDIEFSKMLKDGKGSITLLNWDKRMDSIESSYGSFADEVKTGLEVQMRKWNHENDLANQGDFDDRANQILQLPADPFGFQKGKAIAAGGRTPAVQQKLSELVDKVAGPDARALPDDSWQAQQLAYKAGLALRTGRAGPLTDDNVPTVMASLMASGLSSKKAREVIDNARDPESLNMNTVRTLVSRVFTRTTDSGAQSPDTTWLDRHPNLREDVAMLKASNPKLTEEEAARWIINQATVLQTDQGETALGDIMDSPELFTGITVQNVDEMIASGAISINELNAARRWLEAQGINTNDSAQIARRLAQSRMEEQKSLEDGLDADLTLPPGFFKLQMSPQTSFSVDAPRLPTFDQVSDERKSSIVQAYETGMPQSWAVRDYGTAALEYYEWQRWLQQPENAIQQYQGDVRAQQAPSTENVIQATDDVMNMYMNRHSASLNTLME